MAIENPFGLFKSQCIYMLKKALIVQYPSFSKNKLSLETPPNPEYGELSSSICFEISKETYESPKAIAEKIVSSMDLSEANLISAIKIAEAGYINFYVNYELLGELTLEAIEEFSESYGFVKTNSPERILIEHTSVNPVHAIHIGQARNSVLGDALSRILKARGHTVSRHFYIDDMGRQTAIVAYGYNKLGFPKPIEKPDHFIGNIYSIVSCIIEIQNIKKRIKKLEENYSQEKIDEIKKLKAKLDEWVSIAAELRQKNQELFDKILEEILKDPNPEESLNKLIKLYEKNDKEVTDLVRKVVELCLEGFKQTLLRIGISFDSWDWESKLIWNGKVEEVLNKLLKTKYVYRVNGAIELDSEEIVNELDLRSILNISETYHIPSLTLMRSDGTTLYVTRDIAYTLEKFKLADRVINVIGVEQTLAQLQIKIALFALGYKNLVNKLIHFAFGLVELPAYKMSSRRGRYVTLDQVIDEAIHLALNEVSKRNKELEEKLKYEIAEIIGISAIKYALLSIEPLKTLTFTWDKVLNFEANSAPFINYAYTRACSILNKLKEFPKKFNIKLLSHPLEKTLIIQLAKFPEVFINASEKLRPDDLAIYANELAEKFHKYYEKVDVIHVEDMELRESRAFLVKSVKTVIKNVMDVLGISLSTKM
ncbi:MAG: arginine--tRNA ligase [Candidatus Bathyarchaeia archaeon]